MSGSSAASFTYTAVAYMAHGMGNVNFGVDTTDNAALEIGIHPGHPRAALPDV